MLKGSVSCQLIVDSCQLAVRLALCGPKSQESIAKGYPGLIPPRPKISPKAAGACSLDISRVHVAHLRFQSSSSFVVVLVVVLMVVEVNCEDRRRITKGSRQPEVRSYHRETAEDDDEDEED
jgi:hypothetical protein